MLSFHLAQVRLIEMAVHALDRVSKQVQSPQQEAELAAYFYLRRLGSVVVARNWKSGGSSGDVDLIAWEGDTLCFVDVGTRTRKSGSSSSDRTAWRLRALAKDYLRKTPDPEVPTRFDVLLVDLQRDTPMEAKAGLGKSRPNPQIEYHRGIF